MSRAWLRLVAMTVVVAILGVWVYWQPKEQTQRRERVSALDPATVLEIRLETRDAPAAVVRRESGTWRLVAPVAARADALQAERLLSLLGAAAELALPATELSRYELDSPRLRVSFDGETFSLGATNRLTGGLYLLKDDRVFLVDARFNALVTANAATLTDRHIFGAAEAPVRFVFPQFTVAQESGRWTVAPGDPDLSQDDIARWADQWRQASAVRAERFEGPIPVSVIRVDLRDGRRVTIGVMERDGEIALTRLDEQMRYFMFPGAAKRLLAAPGPAPTPGR